LIRAIDDPSLPKGPMPAPKAAFDVIVTASVSSSAERARDLRFLRPCDGITMNRTRLLADAKAKAIALAGAGYQPPPPRTLRLPGASGRATLANLAETLVPVGVLKGHDLTVARVLARVLTGGATSGEALPETAILDLEREGFLELAGHPATLERISHMLRTGKPLRS
jgi:3-hydroxyacyl-CoA dehydrogenase